MTLPRWLGPGAVGFVALWLLLLTAGRSAFFRDPGTFWHTTTGELILANGFIRADPYTFTFAGSWWVPYQWLGEVGMALAHRAGGFDTQLLGAVTILAATFAWLGARLTRTGLHPIVVCGLTCLALAAAASHFHVRPLVATMAMMTLTAAWLADCDAGRCRLGRLGWLVLLYAVWANIHGGMLAGAASVGLVAAGWIAFWQLGLGSPVRSWRDSLFLAVVVVGCVLAALVNPYGLDLIRTWHVIMGEPALKTIIQEHRPLDLAEPFAWPVIAFAAVYLFVLFGVRPNEIRASWLLPAVWVLMTFDRSRHAPLFAVTGAVAVGAMWPHTRWAAWLGRNRPDFYQPPTGEPRHPLWANLWLPAVLVVTAFVLQVRGVQVPVIGAGWARHDPEHWPVELLDVLKDHEPRSPVGNHLFNEYIDGGFVIYHAPGYKVFVDDRCELFGGPWLLEFVTANDPEQAPAAVANWEREYGPFHFALTRTDSGYDSFFAKSDRWERVKRTATATFYKRK